MRLVSIIHKHTHYFSQTTATISNSTRTSTIAKRQTTHLPLIMNNKYITLAAATAWFAQSGHATQVTSTWHRNTVGLEPNQSLEKSLHAKLASRLSSDHDRDLEEETFIGPGVMECSNAQCTFEVDSSLGCADPCHTREAPKRYEYPFDSFSTVSDPYFNVASDGVNSTEEPCFYRSATDINTWSPELAVIEEGCTAKCTGCTFAAPIVSVSGPAQLQCSDGRCTKYVHGETFDCGTAIEIASEGYGVLSTLPDNETIPHEFYGYEGINGMVQIPSTCSLECTGCTLIDSGSTPPTSTGTDSTSSSSEQSSIRFNDADNSNENNLRGSKKGGKAI